ncbi:MAG: hypothetical protein KC419_12270 [Anaerolineales bacterium]|nr:hypothetical protein [Anaerolineales bacterium]MCA9929254.1 hypothetical protein [Anaerolineales bacterium]
MAIFKNRFPTKQELYYFLLACVFPIHVWSLINVMREIPAWVLRLSIAEMLGVIAYAQLFALLDTLVVFLPLVLVSAVLPASLLRKRFVAVGTAVVFITSGWLIYLHLNNWVFEQRDTAVFAIWGVTYLVAMIGVYLLIQRSEKVAAGISNFVQRLSVLSILYLIVDIISLIIVVVRIL